MSTRAERLATLRAEVLATRRKRGQRTRPRPGIAALRRVWAAASDQQRSGGRMTVKAISLRAGYASHGSVSALLRQLIAAGYAERTGGPGTVTLRILIPLITRSL